MTGGQMAPTTLEGMVTSTCPYGRNVALNGYPLRIAELVERVDGTCYVTRQSVHTPASIRKAKKQSGSFRKRNGRKRHIFGRSRIDL